MPNLSTSIPPPYIYNTNKAFEWMMNNPLQTEQDYHWVGVKDICAPKADSDYTLRINSYATIRGKEREKIMEMVIVHPVADVMNFTQELKNLKNKIYEGRTLRSDDRRRHDMMIVGYDTDEILNKNYWIIQNSWGEACWESRSFRFVKLR
ncbi:cathepsin L-like proteinase [Hibiscus syriacus]|uniref:cathepsin L-like proteinase n=1 Tax=Hibiscus syriacus TaxID=106335 RepID=UPI001923134C|nr:cathepsin L-like proteinase [Hibiscus syriacus]